MKLLFVIDHLGIGGAQNQIVKLSTGMKKIGYMVEFFIYYPQYDFYRPVIDSNNIPVHYVTKSRKGFSFTVLKSLRRILRKGQFSGVIAFLDSPNIYAELASVGISKLKVIVSERNSYLKEKSMFNSFARRVLHLFADHIVANSKTQSEWLNAKFPWLKNKTTIIYNGYESDQFLHRHLTLEPQVLKLIGIGRIARQKNIINLLKALKLFYDKHGWCPTVNWVGSMGESAESGYKLEINKLLDTMTEIRGKWTWLGERDNIPELLVENHALILPSFFEGFPNVICEALFSGRPVLTSDVCDNPVLVTDNHRGFLFDPHSPKSISKAIEKLAFMDQNSWSLMCTVNRKFANENLTLDKMVLQYSGLLN
jgi:glycosyltransferase involved in cell wall biosynthesis